MTTPVRSGGRRRGGRGSGRTGEAHAQTGDKNRPPPHRGEPRRKRSRAPTQAQEKRRGGHPTGGRREVDVWEVVHFCDDNVATVAKGWKISL